MLGQMKMEVEVLLLAGFADEFGEGGRWWDLPWLPLWCCKLRALGVVLVHLCSMMLQDASPTC